MLILIHFILYFRFQYDDNENNLRAVDAISFFKKGIKPIWEDAKNKNGYDLWTKFTSCCATEVDEIYHYLLTSIISSEYPFLEDVRI